MKKDYLKVEFLAGDTIEKSVNRLLDYKEKEILAFGRFNGVALYSDTVTMDGAYKQITGKTKSEFDEYQQEEIEKYKRQKKEHEERVPELVEMWKKKGEEVLSEDKWEYWDRIVPVRLNDLYQGMELSCCLDIIKILNNGGTFNEAKEEIERQNHSGMSFGLVCTMVKEFCDRGEEFVKFVR